MHNDREVSVYLDRTTAALWDAKDLQLEIAAMNALQQAGLYAGVLVSMESKNKLVTQLTESLAATAPDFTLFMASQGRTNVTYPINTNVITVANYEEDDEEEEDSAEKSSIPEAELTAYMANGTKTSMGLFPDYYYHTNPIVVASEIASLLDKTGGPDFLLLVPEDYACFENPVDGGDAMVKLCEELSYLDVAGPTVKSRLVVGACSEEQVDECLKVGVNKLILPHDDDDTEAFRLHLDWIRAIVEKQGKKIVA